jgi:hypothetical protein
MNPAPQRPRHRGAGLARTCSLDRDADGFEAEGIATGRELGEHLLHCEPPEHLSRGEVLTGRDRDFARTVRRSHPRATDRHFLPSEGDRTVIVAVADRCPGGVVPSLRTAQGADALLEDRVHLLQPGADREREQPFTESVREVGHHEATVSGRAISAAAFFVW